MKSPKYPSIPTLKKYGVTRDEFDVLDEARHMERQGLALFTRKKKARESLIARGLLKDVGPCVVTDGDGRAKDPEQWRTGYELTDAGREICTRVETRAGGTVLDRRVWLLPDGNVAHLESFTMQWVDGWGQYDQSMLKGEDATLYAAWRHEHNERGDESGRRRLVR